MSRNNPPAPEPAVASTGCTGLLFSLSRRAVGLPQQQPLPRRNTDETAERLQRLTEQVDRLRLQLLEEEFQRLSRKLLLLDHQADQKEMPVTMRQLEDGSFLREVSRAGRPWERLAVQVSRPVVHAHAASASEVLDKMAAMGADNLCKHLNRSMPLTDIAGRNNPGEPVRRRTMAGMRPRSGDDDGEGLVLEAMGKLECLVLEGLKIQSTAEPTAAVDRRRRERDEAVGNHGKGCCGRILVVLMQARDPTERYAAVGDSMIGLIEEASLDHPERTKDATARLRVHVAGIKSIDRKPSGGRLMLWSSYLWQCKGPHDGGGGGHGCRCTCVRNSNRVFQR